MGCWGGAQRRQKRLLLLVLLCVASANPFPSLLLMYPPFRLPLPHPACSPNQVALVFTPAFLRCLATNLKKGNSHLHGGAKKCVERIAGYCDRTPGAWCEVVCCGWVRGRPGHPSGRSGSPGAAEGDAGWKACVHALMPGSPTQVL